MTKHYFLITVLTLIGSSTQFSQAEEQPSLQDMMDFIKPGYSAIFENPNILNQGIDNASQDFWTKNVLIKVKNFVKEGDLQTALNDFISANNLWINALRSLNTQNPDVLKNSKINIDKALEEFKYLQQNLSNNNHAGAQLILALSNMLIRTCTTLLSQLDNRIAQMLDAQEKRCKKEAYIMLADAIKNINNISTAPTLSENSQNYEILGLTKDASAADIKSRYRKLALQFHPDKNKNECAKTAFMIMQQAYDTLSK